MSPQTSGAKSTQTGAITAGNASSSGVASNIATLTVTSPLTLAEAFGAATIQTGTSTSLTFTVTNLGSVAQTGVAFSDTFPSGLTVASSNGLSSTCGGTVTLGSASVVLAGGAVAANGSCTITLNVTPAMTGTFTNTTGTVSSTQGGTAGTATASLHVVAQGTTDTTANLGMSLNVAPGGTLLIDVIFQYPGTPPVTTPTGAITFTVDGSTSSLSGQTCVFKNTSVGAHANCSVTYTAPATVGTHTLVYSEAADANYTGTSGSGTINVTPQ